MTYLVSDARTRDAILVDPGELAHQRHFSL